MPEFQPLCQFVTAALPSGKDVPAESALQKKMSTCWRKHAGNATMHSQPLLFASGRVVAFVESATWGNEIRHHAEHLRQALIADGIPVTGVEVKIMPLSSSPTTSIPRARSAVAKKCQTNFTISANHFLSRTKSVPLTVSETRKTLGKF